MRKEIEQEERERKGEENEVDLQGPPDYSNFGFHHDQEYVVTTVHFLEASSWVCWPDSGGWASQDTYLVKDVMLYLRLRRRMRWEVKHGINSRYEESADDAPKINLFG